MEVPVLGSSVMAGFPRCVGPEGKPVAQRSAKTGTAGTVFTWLFSSHDLTVDTQTVARTGATTRSYRDPFGVPIGGSTGVWANGNGFLNKPVVGSTKLTPIGARTYAAVIGKCANSKVGGQCVPVNTPQGEYQPDGGGKRVDKQRSGTQTSVQDTNMAQRTGATAPTAVERSTEDEGGYWCGVLDTTSTTTSWVSVITGFRSLATGVAALATVEAPPVAAALGIASIVLGYTSTAAGLVSVGTGCVAHEFDAMCDGELIVAGMATVMALGAPEAAGGTFALLTGASWLLVPQEYRDARPRIDW